LKCFFLAILLGFVCAGGCTKHTAQPADKLIFKNNGFAIVPLDELGNSGDNQVLTMFLPVSSGYPPNVGVTISHFAGRLADYMEHSVKHAEEKKYKILAATTKGDTLLIEYVGPLDKDNIHFYVRAVLQGGTVYLAIANAREEDWHDVSFKLKTCVDSLEVAPTSKPVDKLFLKNNGFAISPLDEPVKEGENNILTMFLPASSGFAPNVSVATLPFSGKLADYMAECKKDVEEVHGKFLTASVNGDAMFLEYSAMIRGMSTHEYEHILLKSGILYIASTGAPEDKWKSIPSKVKACVDSLEVIPTEKSAVHFANSSRSAEDAK
jgi:hypothetical protein